MPGTLPADHPLRLRVIRTALLIVLLLAVLPLLSQMARAQNDPSAESKIELPTEWSTYYVVLLKDGPVSADELGADTLAAIMNSHIQYQLRLQEFGDALAGGGFGQSTDGVIGMTLLRAPSLEEAERVAGEDPAVAAGRLEPVVYEWYVPAGLLPD